MSESYTKKYFKIYFWQGVSLIMNFVSMFVVVPYLTSDPVVYGLYTICISFSIFLSYADLGFVGAGQKYAAEYYAIEDRSSEIKVIGFTSFILGVMLFLFSSLFFVFSRYPDLLVKGIGNSQQENIASSLFLILAIFSPITLLQRLLQMIFGIRMEDYIFQRTNIAGSVLKILSALWFFESGKYDIVGYFLFTQFVNFLAAAINLLIARIRYNYDFYSLFNSIRFDKKVFKKTKGLAFASLLLLVSWILYYELDSVVIGKLLGSKWVAFYAIALTVLSFFRSIFGILYSPFNVRFNHFVGLGLAEELKSFVFQVIVVTAPLVIFPIIIIVIFARPIVLSWVGIDYEYSISLVQYLVLCNLFAFVSYPIGILLMVREQQKQIYRVSFIVPFIFWSGILLTLGSLGLNSFAVFKLVAFMVSFIFYYRIMLNYLQISLRDSLLKIFKPVFLSVSFLIVSAILVKGYLPTDKSKLNLLIIALFGGLLIFCAFFIQYLISYQWRAQVKRSMKIFK